MVGIPPEVATLVVLISIGYFLAGAVWDGTKAVAHKTKCGIMLVVGKHCDPAPPTPTE